MKNRRPVRLSFSIVCLFVLVLCCIAMYRQCSIEAGYDPNAPIEPVISTSFVESYEEPVEEPAPVIDEGPEVQEEIPDIEDEPEVLPAAEIQPAQEVYEMIELEPEPEVVAEPVQDEYVSQYEEIDWSQFVFSDDELSLPDGLYYTTVYVNELYGGEVETLIEGGTPLFSSADLGLVLSFFLTDESLSEFLEYDGDFSYEYIVSHSQSAWFDSNELKLYLEFSAKSLPTGVISIRGESPRTSLGSYAVMGAMDLEPAKFSFSSNVNLTASVQHDRNFVFGSYGVSLSLSNTFSMLNATFSLPLSVSYDKWSGLSFSVGNLYGYKDFPDESLRLSFGGVGSYGFSSGRPFGVTLEKSYSFGTNSAMMHQYSRTIELEEDSTVEVFINGRSVYRENRWFGIYLLKDFVFTQGVNDVTVVIHPLSMGDDTSRDKTLVFSQDYDTSLLAKGDDTWRLGMAVPVGDGISGLGMFWEQTVGFSHVYTQSHHLSVSMQSFNGVQSVAARASISSLLATGIGSTRFNLSGSLNSVDGAVSDSQLSGSIAQSFFDASLKPLSLSLAFSLGRRSSIVSLSSSYSFRLGSLSLGTGLSASYSTGTSGGAFDARASLSLSMPLTSGFNISLSSNIDSSFAANATLTVSKSFGRKTNLNASSSLGTSRKPSVNVSLSHNAGRSSLGLSLGGFNFEDLLGHSLSASWTYRGGLASIALREQASNRYGTFSTSLLVSTSLAFADGHFAMASSIGGPFLIVSPESKARNLGVSASYALNSNPTALAKTFGNFLYTGLSLYTPNSVFVSISQGELLSSNASLYRMTPYAMQGFVASIQYEVLTTATGVVYLHGKALSSYSSPVYMICRVDDGQTDSPADGESTVEVVDSAYVFTDDAGRFVLSELKAATYMFDLNIDGLHYAVVFAVPESVDAGYVLLLDDLRIGAFTVFEDSEKILPASIADSYDGVFVLGNSGFVTEDEFWDIVFGV